MKRLQLAFGKLNSQHIRLLTLLLSLALFILGAGAPESGGGSF